MAMYSVPFLVYKGFGLGDFNVLEVIALQAVLYVAVSALPLPGALGVSESAFMILFRTMFPAGILSSAMVLSRGISFYLFVLVTGLCVAGLVLIKRKGPVMAYTILIAEDDRDIVNLLKLYLESNGYRTVTAENGTDAYKLILEEKIDLAVLDIMMPEMDGYELAVKIREKHDFPIIFLSAKIRIMIKY